MMRLLQHVIFLLYSLLESCVKIGEGVYGEVFKSQYKNGQSIALKVNNTLIFVYYNEINTSGHRQ